MGKENKIRGKDLYDIGYDDDGIRAMASTVLSSKFFKKMPKEDALSLLTSVKADPAKFVDDERVSKLAYLFMSPAEPEIQFSVHELNEEPCPVKVYGSFHIEENAIKQMNIAARLPISVKGSLMPDAHPGYGLPIGGVLAADNAVIPYGVGVDIGCRMALSVFEASEKYLKGRSYEFKSALKEFTHFGNEGGLEFRQEHEILDREEFTKPQLLRNLHGKAARQLGSSGSGNHFVEFGTIELFEDNALGLNPGVYVGLLSHSGSRGLGASIAEYYTDLAMQTCKLPREARHMAWLELGTELGDEYWMAMNLAGDYARACHDRIHINLSKAIGLKPLTKIENHHNFAWKEMVDGRELVVHRKGATPAAEGVFGIIPGNMVDPGYIVVGKGVSDSVNSAAHGAGRTMSRQDARERISPSQMRKDLDKAGVELIGGATDEAPLAYKDIDGVMTAQKQLIEVQGKFTPKIVRMNKE